MRSESALVTALCLILITVWGCGAHVHFSHEHTPGALGHDELDARFASMVEGADHIAAHLHHGHVDLDSPVKAIVKVPALKIPVALIVFLLIAQLLSPTALPLLCRQPPLRPPAWRRRPYLIPPSHAPPFAA